MLLIAVGNLLNFCCLGFFLFVKTVIDIPYECPDSEEEQQNKQQQYFIKPFQEMKSFNIKTKVILKRYKNFNIILTLIEITSACLLIRTFGV